MSSAAVKSEWASVRMLFDAVSAPERSMPIWRIFFGNQSAQAIFGNLKRSAADLDQSLCIRQCATRLVKLPWRYALDLFLQALCLMPGFRVAALCGIQCPAFAAASAREGRHAPAPRLPQHMCNNRHCSHCEGQSRTGQRPVLSNPSLTHPGIIESLRALDNF